MSRLRVENPYDRSTVAEFDWDEGEALERRIESARVAFERWRTIPLDRRMEVVREGVEKIRAEAEVIAREITLQMGKPLAQARGETNTFFERADALLGMAGRALAPDVFEGPKGFHRRIEHVPHGVILEIAAWNYPLIIPVNVIVPALLAGNVVLLKHSPLTPLTGKALEKAFSGLEVEGLVTNLVTTNEVTGQVLQDPRVGHVCFTGSVATGRAVYRLAAERLLDVGLELGGKDAAYVAEDARVGFAAESIVDGACYNAGQSCCAVERVYVHRKRYEEFLAVAKGLVAGYRMGDPLEEKTTLGPLARRENLAVLDAQVKDARARGARVVVGGKRGEEESGFYEATLLANVPENATVMSEESFGPLVPVRCVEGDDEALECMKNSRYGLTASVWTEDRERAERMGNELEVGTVFQNRCDYLDPELPWTGARESGVGSTLSRFGFLGVTRRKSVCLRLGKGAGDEG